MKGPLDGPIFPGGEPEPTEAEFRADWVKLQAVLGPVYGPNASEPEFDEADPLATLRRMELIGAFILRHRKRADAMGMPTQSFLDQAAAQRAKVLQANEALNQAEDRFLDAASEVAEARLQTLEETMAALAELRRLWPTLDEAAQEEWAPAFRDWEEHREAWLSAIPLEERRRLETRYPI